MKQPLKGITVLEFAQYMAGPSAGLKLADLGARVIKIERPKTGEAGRQIALKNIFIDESSMVFHTANRNKESYAANLKDLNDLEKVKKLIQKADIMTHNFRPGVMEKIGLDFKTVKEINPRIIYGVVSGYGPKGPWSKKPGQDLLIQSLSGLAQLSGNKSDHPTPSGLATADLFTGTHLVQGLLAALIQREKTNKGALIEVSLIETAVDIQFEFLTTFLNSRSKKIERAAQGSAHIYLPAPYGIYPTKDHYLAIALTPLDQLLNGMNTPLPDQFKDPSSWFDQRNEIMAFLGDKLKMKSTNEWLAIFEPLDFKVSPVFDYETFLNHPAYQVLQMDQEIITSDQIKMRTTRCPFMIDEQPIFSEKAAPKVGEDNQRINKEFNLD